MKKEFLKYLKTFLISNGWQIDKYTSTPGAISFFKKGPSYYYHISCFPDKWFPFYYLKMGCSPLIITPIYPYGNSNTVYLQDDLVEWCSRFNIDGTNNGYHIDIGVTEESRDRAIALFHLFYATLFEKNYFENAKSQLMNNPIVHKKVDFLRKTTEEFLVEYEAVYRYLGEKSYIKSICDAFAPKVTDIMKDVVSNIEFSFENLSTYTNAYLMFSKKFEKVMKSTPDIRTKFLFYSNFIYMIPTGDDELDLMLRINLVPIYAEYSYALQYSAFMTFIEKPYC